MTDEEILSDSFCPPPYVLRGDAQLAADLNVLDCVAPQIEWAARKPEPHSWQVFEPLTDPFRDYPPELGLPPSGSAFEARNAIHLAYWRLARRSPEYLAIFARIENDERLIDKWLHRRVDVRDVVHSMRAIAEWIRGANDRVAQHVMSSTGKDGPVPQAALSALASAVADVCRLSGLLADMTLAASGYYQHARGEWRKRRAKS